MSVNWIAVNHIFFFVLVQVSKKINELVNSFKGFFGHTELDILSPKTFLVDRSELWFLHVALDII